MKWMKQFGIILLISFVGEILEKWIPLPIPASIYGIILLFLCLKLNIIPHEAVHETGKFLIEIMPLMFIPAAVGLLETWDVIAPAWLEYVAVTVPLFRPPPCLPMLVASDRHSFRFLR